MPSGRTFYERINALPRTEGRGAAAEAIRIGDGPRITNEFHDIVQTMQDEEDGLLAKRTADAKRQLEQAKIALILGTVLGFVDYRSQRARASFSTAAGAAWRKMRCA